MALALPNMKNLLKSFRFCFLVVTLACGALSVLGQTQPAFNPAIVGVVMSGVIGISSPNAVGPRTQIDYAWDMMCGGRVRPIAKKLKRSQKGQPVELSDSIQLCTKHVYEFSGKSDQHLRVRLPASTNTWVILFRKESGQYWEEGRTIFPPTREWEGVLPRNGKYRLIVVTTKSTTYTLNVKFQ